MTKHHYGLLKKEQINLPKNVTPPPRKLTHVSLKTDYLSTWTIYIFQPLIFQETKNRFFSFKGPQHNFRPSRALKKQWETTRGSRKGPPPSTPTKDFLGTSRLDQTTSWRWTSGDFNPWTNLPPKRQPSFLARLDIPDGFSFQHRSLMVISMGGAPMVYVTYMKWLVDFGWFEKVGIYNSIYTIGGSGMEGHG